MSLRAQGFHWVRIFNLENRPVAGWRHAPPRGIQLALSGFDAQRPPSSLGSYFQLAQQYRRRAFKSAVGFVLAKPSLSANWVPCAAEQPGHWVRIFKLARATHRELSNRRLASFFQPPASPKLASLRKTAVVAKLVPQKTPFVRPSLRICATRPPSGQRPCANGKRHQIDLGKRTGRTLLLEIAVERLLSKHHTTPAARDSCHAPVYRRSRALQIYFLVLIS